MLPQLVFVWCTTVPQTADTAAAGLHSFVAQRELVYTLVLFVLDTRLNHH